MFDFLFDIFFPRVCLVCRVRIARGVVCDSCFGSISTHTAFVCGQCFATADRKDLRRACHPDFPYTLGTATNYQNATVQSLVHHLKFRSVKDAAKPLANLIARFIKENGAVLDGSVVVPIPLSRKRQRSRGFNQAEQIARCFAQDFNLPVTTDVLVRAKHTAPQSGATSVAIRQENIRGSFSIASPEMVRGKTVLLIDDVTTSGATFYEAAIALRTADVKNVIALAAAKA